MARVLFKVEENGGYNIGRCYNRYEYKIYSAGRLSADMLKQLFNMGLIGCGQEFKISSQCDGKELWDHEKNGFEYQCTVICDSSD